MFVFGFEKVTRVTVVGTQGVAFEDYEIFPNGGVELHLQDDGRTLKLFPIQPEVVAPWSEDLDFQETENPTRLEYDADR